MTKTPRGHRPHSRRGRSRLLLVLAPLLLSAACTGIGGGPGSPLGAAASATPPTPSFPAKPVPKPNIVLVLTDDLSMNLVQYMPHVLALQHAGTSFSNYTVTDSLCCPSRSSIFSGKFPHDTGVFTNTGKDGGFNVFHDRGEENANTVPSSAPSWLARRPPLTSKQTTRIDTAFRKRVQAVQSVDRMIASLQSALTKAGVADSTDIVFSSDNGYHMGEYRLMPGKMTAFDTDVNVPLVAAGPGIPAGRTVGVPVQNIDLAPTFEALAGAPTPTNVDGHNLVPLLSGGSAGWRTAALVEHHGPDTVPSDPDYPAKHSGNPPSYQALRTTAYTYVEYTGGAKEYEDRRTDPAQLHNTVADLPPTTLSALHTDLAAMVTCHGEQACWTAGHLAQ